MLERKTGIIRGPDEESPEDPPRQEAVAPEVSYRLPIADEEPPETAPVTYEDAREAEPEEYISPSPEDITQQDTEDAATQQQVHIAGASRRKRELSESSSPYAGRSYKPTARLPEYKRSLRRGDFEIRVHNYAPTKLQVAIISSEGGRDMTIPSGGVTSAFVGRGMYDLYYIYDDDPFTLYQGQRLPVDETLSDFVVEIYDDSYTVRFLDRNIEPSGTSRR